MSDDEKNTWKGSISLPDDLYEFMEEEKGPYGNRSSVVQEALRLMRQMKEKQNSLENSGKANLRKAKAAIKKKK